DAGHHRMTQAKSGHSFGDAARLILIDGTRLTFGNSAESTAPGTDIAQQHESGGAMIPALPHVGAMSRPADRMQAPAACQFLQIVEILPDGRLRLEPCRLWLPHGRTKLNLYEFSGARHALILNAGKHRCPQLIIVVLGNHCHVERSETPMQPARSTQTP